MFFSTKINKSFMNFIKLIKTTSFSERTAHIHRSGIQILYLYINYQNKSKFLYFEKFCLSKINLESYCL